MIKILAVVALIVVIGGGAYIATTMHADPDEVTVHDEQEQSEQSVPIDESDAVNAEQIKGEGTLTSLLALGKSITCNITYSDPETDYTISGTMYSANNHLRADYKYTMQGEEYEGHVISDSDTSYMWSETPMGVMASKYQVTVDEPETKKTDKEPNPVDEKYIYDCYSWRPDQSKFNVPTDIEFKDMSAQINQSIKAGADVQDMQCSACDQLPNAEAKAQCKVALNC